ncbi:MAG TPA: hypothetical protein VEZ71_31810 [Archangium sp.]|nr:hypothetical protein [Archangium sp.]
MRPAANTLQPPATGAVARLLVSLRGLPEAVRAPGPGSTGLAGWFKAETPPSTDITARFREVHQRVLEGEPVLPDEARRHLYLDHAEAALTGLPGFSNYFPSDITEAMVALAIETPGGL